jgi:hypothetical protein
MKKRVVTMPKRVGRSKTIIDIDDFFIMWNLRDYVGSKGIVRDTSDDFEMDESIKTKYMEIENLKRLMNLSHKGLLVHLKRLEKYHILIVARSTKNYKVKTVALTYSGKNILNYLLDSKEIKVMISDFNNRFKH